MLTFLLFLSAHAALHANEPAELAQEEAPLAEARRVDGMREDRDPSAERAEAALTTSLASQGDAGTTDTDTDTKTVTKTDTGAGEGTNLKTDAELEKYFRTLASANSTTGAQATIFNGRLQTVQQMEAGQPTQATMLGTPPTGNPTYPYPHYPANADTNVYPWRDSTLRITYPGGYIVGRPSETERLQCYQQLGFGPGVNGSLETNNCRYRLDGTPIETEQECSAAFMMPVRLHNNPNDEHLNPIDSTMVRSKHCMLIGEIQQCAWNKDSVVCPGAIPGSHVSNPATPNRQLWDSPYPYKELPPPGTDKDCMSRARCGPDGGSHRVCPENAVIEVACRF